METSPGFTRVFQMGSFLDVRGAVSVGGVCVGAAVVDAGVDFVTDFVADDDGAVAVSAGLDVLVGDIGVVFIFVGVVVGICADVGGVEGFGAGALFFLLRLKHEMEKALLETRFTSIQLQLAEKSW